jgi:hypothetical protein
MGAEISDRELRSKDLLDLARLMRVARCDHKFGHD